jgi:hypothetical protein
LEHDVFPHHSACLRDLCLQVDTRSGEVEVVAGCLVVNFEVVFPRREGSDWVAARVLEVDRWSRPHRADEAGLADGVDGARKSENDGGGQADENGPHAAYYGFVRQSVSARRNVRSGA